jgi:hypothetical protein
LRQEFFALLTVVVASPGTLNNLIDEETDLSVVEAR